MWIRIIERIKPSIYRESFLYVFWSAVNLAFAMVLLFILHHFMPVLIANSIATTTSVVVAYFVNSRMVFHTEYQLSGFLKFMFMRIGTIGIDFIGMWFLLNLGFALFIAKPVVVFTNTTINFLFSKFYIFKKFKGTS